MAAPFSLNPKPNPYPYPQRTRILRLLGPKTLFFYGLWGYFDAKGKPLSLSPWTSATDARGLQGF